MNDEMKLIDILITINFAGFVWGIWYYYFQLTETSPLLWVFVIDCPLYTLLLAIVFIFAAIGLRNKLASALVAVGAIKYGIWTDFVLVYYGDYFFQSEPLPHSLALFVAHIGLILQAFLLIGRKIPKIYAAILLGWFLFSDYMDYIAGTAPYLPEKEPIVMYLAIALTLSITTFVYFANKSKINFFGWSKTLTNLRKEIIGKNRKE